MIVTLCGSGRFEPWYKMWKLALAMAGHPAFDLTAYPSDYGGVKDWYTPEVKEAMDGVHFKKMEASGAIIFLNVFAYLGTSSLKEFEYAKKLGKRILFLESWGAGLGIGVNHYDHIRASVKHYGVPSGFGSPIDTSVHETASFSDLLGPAGSSRSTIIEMLNQHAQAAMSVP